MSGENILISGASIAGPALAYWLQRYGFHPTVVERAPALREGGQAVDFRGPVHLNLLRKMGLLERIRHRQTDMGVQRVLDSTGKVKLTLPASFLSGDVEILRGDLSEILYEAGAAGTEYVFGDFVTSLTDTGSGVEVTFDRAAPRTFDLVVGADGLHSGVRSLAFGPESAFTHFSGYYYGGAAVPNHLGLDRTGLLYNVPARSVSLSSTGGDLAAAGFVFASPRLDYDRHDSDAQRKIVAEAFHGVGWEVPRLIKAMTAAPEIYFDSISQVRMDSFTKGRVALLGDAGYGSTIGGMGSGLAVIAAYVLAGELAAARGDHRIAFPAYASRIEPYARGCQKIGGNAGPFLAPATSGRLWRRNQAYRLLANRWFSGYLNKLTTKAASAIDLPDYAG
ncbi:MAG TPA: FAD-dependent monooxygenase [Pseudonocardiaceae bacterium]|jgi:2-polyprenyl-6-methoxyphenol hydroxylase-like FAD-dependent oxidoreductase|nr:FAD-dependent monooxygenase [Pseudonocardiaceae bacterium]